MHGLLKVIQAIEPAIVGQDSICDLVVVWFLNLLGLILYIKLFYWVKHIWYILVFTCIFTLKQALKVLDLFAWWHHRLSLSERDTLVERD